MKRIMVLPLALSIGCTPAIKGDGLNVTVSGLPEYQECKADDLAELNRAPDCEYLTTLRNSTGGIYFQMRKNGFCRQLFYDFNTDGKLDQYYQDDHYTGSSQDLQERFARLRECPQ